MGQRGVEPRTSRLSGAHFESSIVAIHSESAPRPASRLGNRESGKAANSPSARTQSVPAKIDPAPLWSASDDRRFLVRLFLIVIGIGGVAYCGVTP